MIGSQFRVSSEYDVLYIGAVTPVRFTVYEVKDGKKRPHDLTQYDSVHLIVYDSDTSPSARVDLPLSVLTADADKVLDTDGTTLVAARVTGNLLVTGATGEARAKLNGVKGVSVFLLDKPWKLQLQPAGPNS